MNSAEHFMEQALTLAREAMAHGEVPVGAVVVKDGQVIATGRNRREEARNALCHAEIEAIHRACETLGGWRLWQCELYVTLEPCPMCAGAIVNARIPQVFFGAWDYKNGAGGSAVDLFQLPHNYRPQVTGGVLEQECAALLSSFFRNLRRAAPAPKPFPADNETLRATTEQGG